jgi:hypothetical protein
MMRVESSVSVDGGVAAKHRVVTTKQEQRAFRICMLGELEIKSWKRAKAFHREGR